MADSEIWIELSDLEHKAKEANSIYLSGNDLTAEQVKAMVTFAKSLHDQENPSKDEIEAILLYQNALTFMQSKGSIVFTSSEELMECQSQVTKALEDADLFLSAGLLLKNESNFKGAMTYLIKAESLGHPQAARWLKGINERLLDSTYVSKAAHDHDVLAFIDISSFNNTVGAFFRYIIIFIVGLHMMPMAILGILFISYIQSNMPDHILNLLTCGREEKSILNGFLKTLCCLMGINPFQGSGDSNYNREPVKAVFCNLATCGCLYVYSLCCFTCVYVSKTADCCCNCPCVCMTIGLHFPRQQLEALRGDFNILTEEGTLGKSGGKKSNALTIFIFLQILSGFALPIFLWIYYYPVYNISALFVAYLVWWFSTFFIICFHEIIIWQAIRGIVVESSPDASRKIRSTIFAIDRQFNIRLCQSFGIEAIDVPDIYTPLWLYPLVSLFPAMVAAFATQTWLLYRFNSDYFEIMAYFAGNVYATAGIIQMVGSYILNYVSYNNSGSSGVAVGSSNERRDSLNIASVIAQRHQQRHGKGLKKEGNNPGNNAGNNTGNSPAKITDIQTINPISPPSLSSMEREHEFDWV